MTRKAILLSAPAQIPTHHAGVNATIWRNFLLSNPGGAWAEHEVTTLENPDRDAVLGVVKAAKDADYCLLVFNGRGEIRKGDLPWPEARILLSDGTSLSEAQLNSGSPRCTLIFDWSKSATHNIAWIDDLLQDSHQSRLLFDDALEKAEGGLVKIYASQTDATSPTPSFSALLLQSAQAWASSNQGNLSLQQAVSLVMNASSPASTGLKAEYQGGRRLRHFPLAVNPKP